MERMTTEQEPTVILADHPVAPCVDLRRTFAGRFRFAWDEAYRGERPDFRPIEAPWLTIIPCRFGTILPWGGRRLAAYSAAGATKRRELERLAGVTVAQGGGPGAVDVVVTFDGAAIEAVAAVLRPRRARRLTAEQRAALVARGRRWQFGRHPASDPEARSHDHEGGRGQGAGRLS